MAPGSTGTGQPPINPDNPVVDAVYNSMREKQGRVGTGRYFQFDPTAFGARGNEAVKLLISQGRVKSRPIAGPGYGTEYMCV
jgi:hypothetical protein